MNNLDLYRLARFTRPSWHPDEPRECEAIETATTYEGCAVTTERTGECEQITLACPKLIEVFIVEPEQ